MEKVEKENASTYLMVDMETSKLYLAFPSHPWINHPSKHQVFQYIDTFTEKEYLPKFQSKYLKSSGAIWR